jgi:hypothetical protein
VTGTVVQKPAPRKISKNGQRNAPEPIRLTGVSSWVLQWLVLCGSPYRGFRGICLTRPNEPASQLASHFPLRGRPFGHREASLLICNFTRVAQTTPVRKRHTKPAVAAWLQLSKNSNLPAQLQSRTLWETAAFVGNSPAQ